MGRVAFGITALAAAYSVALLAFGVVDFGSPAPGMQALLATQLVGALLYTRCTTGSRGATVAAWGAVALLVPYSVLGALSLAAGLLPAAALLAVAALVTPAP